jgi:hypothetical protein
MKLEIGQTLYREIHYRNDAPYIKQVKITSIGRKYFYVDSDERHPIEINSMTYTSKNYSQHNFTLRLTENEILECWEKNKLCEKLRKLFAYFSKPDLTLDQLRQIDKIIDPCPHTQHNYTCKEFKR